jgi:hypothetical protein
VPMLLHCRPPQSSSLVSRTRAAHARVSNLYGIVFDHDTIKELRLRIASLLRSTTCARAQQVYGISRKAGVAAMSSATLETMLSSSLSMQ